MTGEIDRTLAVQVRGLCKRYAKNTALMDVDMTLSQGALFGLVGANGAGKTTLIKCLLDFCEFELGSIEIFGIPSTHTSARRRLAFLPERFAPPYYLTGQDFLQFMTRMYERRYERSEARAVLDALEMPQDALGKPVRTLSKGMTQKLGLAACLLSARDLLVLDEPASGLDPKARALLKKELKRLRDGGATLLLTSHALADVEELCDQMAVLHDGHVRYFGTPEGLKQRHHCAGLEQAYLACIA
jgi:ABC-2 type transport system ATP-binding protein